MDLMRRHYASWDENGCSILVDGWTDNRDRSLINFVVQSSAGTMFYKSIDASGKVKNTHYLKQCFREIVDQIGVDRVVQVGF